MYQMRKKNTSVIAYSDKKTLIFTISVFYMQECLCKISPHPWQNIGLDFLQKNIQFFLGGFPADGHPERAVNPFRVDLHGFQNMAAVTLGTGGPGADADARVL